MFFGKLSLVRRWSWCWSWRFLRWLCCSWTVLTGMPEVGIWYLASQRHRRPRPVFKRWTASSGATLWAPLHPSWLTDSSTTTSVAENTTVAAKYSSKNDHCYTWIDKSTFGFRIELVVKQFAKNFFDLLNLNLKFILLQSKLNWSFKKWSNHGCPCQTQFGKTFKIFWKLWKSWKSGTLLEKKSIEILTYRGEES